MLTPPESPVDENEISLYEDGRHVVRGWVSMTHVIELASILGLLPQKEKVHPLLMGAILRKVGGELRLLERELVTLPPTATITRYDNHETGEIVFRLIGDSPTPEQKED